MWGTNFSLDFFFVDTQKSLCTSSRFHRLVEHRSAVRIVHVNKSTCLLLRNNKNNGTKFGAIIFIVAGARFERAYQGYEPCELPLLYPANAHTTTKIRKKQDFN